MEDNAQTGGRNSLRGNICQRPAIIIIYRCTHTNLKYALFCNLRPCKKLMDCSPFFSHLLLHAIKQIFWAHSARGNWPLIINQQNMRRKTRFNKTMHFDKYTVRIIYLLQKSNLKLRCSKWRPINVFYLNAAVANSLKMDGLQVGSYSVLYPSVPTRRS